MNASLVTLTGHTPTAVVRMSDADLDQLKNHAVQVGEDMLGAQLKRTFYKSIVSIIKYVALELYIRPAA